MTAPQFFQRLFSSQSLKDLYFSKVQSKAAVGLDRINRIVFERKLKENIETASKKVIAGTYRFSDYKEKLVLKGRDVLPRSISIPTIRDKVVLKALNELLTEVFSPDLNIPSVHSVINDVKNSVQTGIYDYFLKFDIKNFYPSVNHKLLKKKIRRRIRKKEIDTLVTRAISKPTKVNSEENLPRTSQGIPQGLSISNILANVYLAGLDKKHQNATQYKYFRYVDDILILCQKDEATNLSKELKSDIVALELELNTEKEMAGEIKKSAFAYLGYSFSSALVTVKETNKEKLINSLIDTLAQFKYSKGQLYEVLEWRLNLRITGCIFDNRKFGWLFFFSQIDDLRLLYHLDHETRELLKRFGIDVKKVRLKRFVRTYHEIRKNMSNTTYIRNFDRYDLEQKRAVLKEIFRFRKADTLSGDEVETYFRSKIFKTIKDLEKDFQPFS